MYALYINQSIFDGCLSNHPNASRLHNPAIHPTTTLGDTIGYCTELHGADNLQMQKCEYYQLVKIWHTKIVNVDQDVDRQYDS